MTQFEPGKKYTCKSVADHGCTFCFEVESRTEKTVTVRKVENWTGSKAMISNKVKIFKDGEEEYIYPMGRYSMASVLRATQEYK
jgi:hypothetical protein